MNTIGFHRFYVGVVIFIVGVPTGATAMGLNVVGTAPPCDTLNQNLVGHFSSSGAQYTATGTCTTPGSLGTSRTFPYTVKGAYSNNIAEEVIEVLPAPISQPSHPSGKWQTKYSCPSDPWLTPDGPPFDPTNPRLKCQIIARNDQSPDFGPRSTPLSQVFDAWRANKPMTSVFVMPGTRSALAAQRDKDLYAEAEEKRLKARLQQAPFSASLSPVVVAPSAGQRFFSQIPIPIKLAPPAPWADTQIDIHTGAPVKTAKSVTAYMVRLERKDPNGNWVAHATIPVGAAQAESPAGYTGFGAGAPPAFLSVPGGWRLSAQVTAPQQSGWSDWIEFVVMTPSTNKALQPAVKGFSK